MCTSHGESLTEPVQRERENERKREIVLSDNLIFSAELLRAGDVKGRVRDTGVSPETQCLYYPLLSPECHSALGRSMHCIELNLLNLDQAGNKPQKSFPNLLLVYLI